MVVCRGEIWWANLHRPRGSEPGYRRPIVILQDDAINRSGVNTVIAAILTTNLAIAEARGNVYLTRDETGLPRDSVANLTLLITLDKQHLLERVRKLPVVAVRHVDDGLRLILSLT